MHAHHATTPPIQDNSFLVEEAYNQEPGVVQTIQTYTRLAGTGDWAYSLTQEWPVPDIRNQLSVSSAPSEALHLTCGGIGRQL